MGGFAWVTLATNDSYSLGALVLAHSLRQVGTAQQLAVLVTPGVTNPMREKLSQAFDLVQEVNILDSKDETNLRLLQRPELGITFTKLHCWRLTQYEKCVFLDADTLVLENADELFEREEFSAAPDVGWPDCFNSGVFVYRPSNETYESLVKFALEKGSFDGGDQGLLNLYFSDWAHKDISKHLPFIYNMCSTACYSYLPAFKQFGANVKIVHFIGATKPWLQYFDTESRRVHPSGGMHHLQAVLQRWWDIFCSLIHPVLTPDMARGSWSKPLTEQQIPFQSSNETGETESSTDYRNVWDPWEHYDENQTQTGEFVNQFDQFCSQSECSFETAQSISQSSLSDQSNQIYQSIQSSRSTSIHHDDSTHLSSCPDSSQSVEQSHKSPQVSDIQQHAPIGTNALDIAFSSSDSHSAITHSNFQTPYATNPIYTTDRTTNRNPSSYAYDSTIPKASTNAPNDQKPNESLNKNKSSNPKTWTPAPECELPSTENALQSHEASNFDAGLAGAFAQFTLGAPRSGAQSALEDHLRRQGWEVGNIDYMGRDSFDNIWSKICETISSVPQPQTPKPREPSPTSAPSDQKELEPEVKGKTRKSPPKERPSTQDQPKPASESPKGDLPKKTGETTLHESTPIHQEAPKACPIQKPPQHQETHKEDTKAPQIPVQPTLPKEESPACQIPPKPKGGAEASSNIITEKASELTETEAKEVEKPTDQTSEPLEKSLETPKPPPKTPRSPKVQQSAKTAEPRTTTASSPTQKSEPSASQTLDKIKIAPESDASKNKPKVPQSPKVIEATPPTSPPVSSLPTNVKPSLGVEASQPGTPPPKEQTATTTQTAQVPTPPPRKGSGTTKKASKAKK